MRNISRRTAIVTLAGLTSGCIGPFSNNDDSVSKTGEVRITDNIVSDWNSVPPESLPTINGSTPTFNYDPQVIEIPETNEIYIFTTVNKPAKDYTIQPDVTNTGNPELIYLSIENKPPEGREPYIGELQGVNTAIKFSLKEFPSQVILMIDKNMGVWTYETSDQKGIYDTKKVNTENNG